MEHSHFTPVIPPHEVRWFGPGEECLDPKNGDILLVDHGTIASRIIEDLEKAATLTEPELNGYTWCGHAANIRTDLPGGNVASEMGFRGLERNPMASYEHRDYAVVTFTDATDRQRAVFSQFDDAMADLDYGWFEYLPIAFDDLTHAQFSGSWGDHLICSARTMLCAAPLGFMGDRLAIRTEPMRIAYWLDAKH